MTHDQKEALSVSDRMAVLDGGKILQVGTPQEIYRRPARKTVANFIGETDFIPGKLRALSGGCAKVETAVGDFEGVLGDPHAAPAVGAEVTLSIRPECWVLAREAPACNGVAGRIGESVYLGEVAQHEFVPRAGGAMLKIYDLNPRFLGATDGGGEVFAGVAPEDVVVLVE